MWYVNSCRQQNSGGHHICLIDTTNAQVTNHCLYLKPCVQVKCSGILNHLSYLCDKWTPWIPLLSTSKDSDGYYLQCFVSYIQCSQIKFKFKSPNTESRNISDNKLLKWYFYFQKKQTNGIDLFALPSKFLHPNERIRIIKQLTPFMYVIATDYSLVVTDERFPGHPVRFCVVIQ